MVRTYYDVTRQYHRGNGSDDMAAILQMFLFLFKSKYRRKFSFQQIFVCLVVVYSSVFNVMCSAKCSDVHCTNGECVNGTCVCYDGWQGPSCQFCGGKVRYDKSLFIRRYIISKIKSHLALNNIA